MEAPLRYYRQYHRGLPSHPSKYGYSTKRVMTLVLLSKRVKISGLPTLPLRWKIRYVVFDDLPLNVSESFRAIRNQDPGIVFAKILFFHIHPWLTRKESWYVMYPHDANCKNKALLYLLKTDKANRRQNTHSRYFSRSKTISSTQCLVMANCFIRNCLIMLCCGMKRVKFFFL